jgi:phage I-like protein
MPVIPFRPFTKADENLPWDGPGEIAKASPEDLRLMAAWYDIENRDNKGAYKLPHHRQEDKAVVWNGVAAAMAALLGARGGVDLPGTDRQGVYRHLARHYQQFEKEPPELRMADRMTDNKGNCKYEFLSGISSFDNEDIFEKIILPTGTHHTKKYGDITITKDYCEKIAEHFRLGVMGERKPFIDTQHDFGEANGWIRGLSATDKGLLAQIEWNDLGRDKIKKKIYKYLSCAIDDHIETTTGTKYYPVLHAVSLTNCPVMETMPAVGLSDDSGHSAPVIILCDGHSHVNTQKGGIMDEMLKGKNPQNPEKDTNLFDLVRAINDLSDGDKAVLMGAFGTKIQPKENADVTTATNPIATTSNAIDLSALNTTIKAAIEEGFKAGVTTLYANSPKNVVKEKTETVEPESEEPGDTNKKYAEKIQHLEALLGVVKSQNDRLNKQWKELAQERHIETRDRLLEQAMQDGKFLPAEHSYYKAMYDQNPEGVKELLNHMPGSSLFQVDGTGSVGPNRLHQLGITEEDANMMSKMGLSQEDMIKGNMPST